MPNHIASELQDLQPPVGLTLDLHIEDGAFVLGDSPGLGIRVDEEAIRPSAVVRVRTPSAGPASGRSGPASGWWPGPADQADVPTMEYRPLGAIDGGRRGSVRSGRVTGPGLVPTGPSLG